MPISMRLYKALQFAIEAHENQYDLGGNPYIMHPIYVASCMDTEDEKIVALFHDIIEDTNYTYDDIRKLGFGELCEAISRITKRKGKESYAEYMNRVSGHPIALKVKIADMKHNLDKSRLTEITDRDKRRLEKYQKWLPILESKRRQGNEIF